jgi:cell division protein FtsW
VSEALSFSQRLQAGFAHWGQVITGRASGAQAAGGQGLPVNLGSYDFARNGAGSGTRLQSVDQALVWVVVALLMWGMVMV